jgi:hypothetical protein
MLHARREIFTHIGIWQAKDFCRGTTFQHYQCVPGFPEVKENSFRDHGLLPYENLLRTTSYTTRGQSGKLLDFNLHPAVLRKEKVGNAFVTLVAVSVPAI